MASSSVIGLAKRVFNRLISALYVDQSTAEAGTAETGILSPLRVSQAISALATAGAGIASYDATVDSEAELQAAVTAGGRILVTGDIALADYITLPSFSTPVHVDLADGVEVTSVDGGSGYAVFESAGSFHLTLDCGRGASFVAGGASSQLVTGTQSSACLLEARTLRLTGSGTTGFRYLTSSGSNLSPSIDRCEVYLQNTLCRFYDTPGLARYGVVQVTGSGTSSRFQLDAAHVEYVELLGTMNGGAGAAFITPTLETSGVVGFVDATQVTVALDPTVLVNGKLLGGRGPSSAGGGWVVAVGSAASASNLVNAALRFQSTTTSTNGRGAVYSSDVVGLNLESGAYAGVFYDCFFNDCDLNSADLKNVEFVDCTFFSCPIVFRADSYLRLIRPIFGTGNSITVVQDSYGEVIGADSGMPSVAGTDTTFRVTGSADVSNDTDPTTRRFGHATLDAFRDRCLAYYPGTSSPQRNLAPVLGQDRAGPLLPQTAGATIVGGKFNIAGTSDRFTGGWCLRPYGIWAEFTVSFKVTPTTGNTGTQRNMFRIGPNVISLNNESGRVRLYINGGSVVFPASVVFADATEALVQATRKEGTAYVYIDGVEVGSGANTALFNNWDEVSIGWNSGTGVIGTYSDVYIFDRALSLAELALLDANPLQGADI